jgi:ABC-2 type transport system ATP-binding protein
MIETINLTKRYGELVALNNLNLVINEGDCFGFIGPNGAGKTTTIKILATLLKPSSGQAKIAGLTVGYQNRQIRPLIGYVPDFMGAYEDMVVTEYLEFFAAAYNIHGSSARRSSPTSSNSPTCPTRPPPKSTASPAACSSGSDRPRPPARPQGPAHGRARQRPRPPRPHRDARAPQGAPRMGKTILISSHILPELAELCNVVGIIERGQLLFSGTVDEIVRRAKMGHVIHVGVTDRLEDAAKVLAGMPGVKKVTPWSRATIPQAGAAPAA